MTKVVRHVEEQSQSKGVRRSHRKSKNGCSNCKKRRVKCDEIRPTCSNCAHFSIRCDFVSCHSPTESSRSDPPSEVHDNAVVAPQKRRGRPRKAWDTLLKERPKDSVSTEDGLYQSLSAGQAIRDNSPGLNVEHMELLHHYTVSTAATFASDGPVERFWRVHVVKAGLSHPFIIQLCLSLAAMHLAFLEQGRRGHYSAIAERHFNRAIPQLIGLLPKLGADNCHALYIASIQVCFYTFAKGPSEGDYLIFSDQGPAAWLPLLKGVRSIAETVDSGDIWASFLNTNQEADTEENTKLMTHATKHQQPVAWKEPVMRLRHYIDSTRDAHSDTYLSALDRLQTCFEATYDNDYTGSPENRVVLRWFYMIEDELVLCMQEKQPVALILLAYFTVLMQTLESFWFMTGWVEHLLTGIRKSLAEAYREWLQWPKEQTQSRF